MILVGTRLDDDNGRNSNSAYPFTYNGRTWNESAKLTAADGQANDYFNWSVVLTIGVTLDIDAYVANDGTMTQTIPISAGQSAANLTIANPQPAVSETVKITLNVVTGTAVIQNTFPNTLHNPLNLTLTFIDPVQGDSLCSLCFVDWLLKLLGFDTSFWMLYHMTLTDLQASDAWPYYHNLFNQHTAELTTIMATNPTVLWHTYDALGTWTPAIAAADNGNGSSFVVSQQMADEAILTLEGIRDNVSPALAAQIQVEIDVLDPNDMVRQTMDDVFVQVENRIQGQVYLPFISK
ncbi:MAG: hypothetical protein GY796_11020 [Chloroflexi bacterium]|nr:hypothetical protein [Chloroflexota bacterium]